MKDLDEMQNQNGADPEVGAAIEPLNDFQARLAFLDGPPFGVIWQGRNVVNLPYGTPGACWRSVDDRRFLMGITPYGNPIDVDSKRDLIFVPAWGRSLRDMLAPDEPPTVNEPPSTVNVPPAPWEICGPGHLCETCQRIQEARRDAVKVSDMVPPGHTLEQVEPFKWDEKLWEAALKVFPRDEHDRIIMEGPEATLYKACVELEKRRAELHCPKYVVKPEPPPSC